MTAGGRGVIESDHCAPSGRAGGAPPPVMIAPPFAGHPRRRRGTGNVRRSLAAWLIVGAAVAGGCGRPGVKPRVIAVRVDPIQEVRSILSRYAHGEPLASEAADFDRLVEGVKVVSAQRGEILERGLAALAAPGADVPGEARTLLAALGIAVEGPPVPGGPQP